MSQKARFNDLFDDVSISRGMIARAPVLPLFYDIPSFVTLLLPVAVLRSDL
jgi:hypothetical protein